MLPLPQALIIIAITINIRPVHNHGVFFNKAFILHIPLELAIMIININYYIALLSRITMDRTAVFLHQSEGSAGKRMPCNDCSFGIESVPLIIILKKELFALNLKMLHAVSPVNSLSFQLHGLLQGNFSDPIVVPQQELATYTLIFTQQGEGCLTWDNEAFSIMYGTCFLLNPHCTIEIRNSGQSPLSLWFF
ncbi:hypothetical protein ACFTAO_45205 [Paenibacillus rhizoplanae]